MTIRNAIHAFYYRRAVAGCQSVDSNPKSGTYTITYKEQKQIKSVTVAGKTEASALLEATKTHNIRYDKIISLVKN